LAAPWTAGFLAEETKKMALVAATWEDLGYRLLGPSTPGNRDELEIARSISTVIGNTARYKRMEVAGDVWIREHSRQKGHTIPECMKITMACSSIDLPTLDMRFLDDLVRSGYGGAHQDIPMDVTQRRDKVNAFEKSPGTAQSAYGLSLAFGSCPHALLGDFIRGDLLPAFFRTYPGGRALFISTNYEFESRNAVLRGGYAIMQLGKPALALKKFDALTDWQPLSTLVQPRNILDLGGFAFFPTVQWMTLYRPGLFALLVPDVRIQHSPPDFPAGWLDIARSHWDFGREDLGRESFTVRLSGITGSYAALRRYMHDPGWSVSDIEIFVRWLVERYNVLAFHQTDPTEYLTRNPTAPTRAVVDFVTCFEHALTLDRVLRKAISCIASEETATRKAAAMEIADIVEAQREYWTASKLDSNWFKTLFHPTNGAALLKAIFQKLPTPFSHYMVGVIDSLYAHLESTVIDSMYVKAKIATSGGILVKNRDGTAENEETRPDFTANVIRALRNAHHGYFTELDRSRRPSRYLALVTGDLPETLSYLGVLFAIGLLADPEALIGWRTIPVGAFD
jgi:hypothetical protein